MYIDVEESDQYYWSLHYHQKVVYTKSRETGTKSREIGRENNCFPDN